MNRSHPIQSWLRLLRAPNLFTVPGDPLAGFLVASVPDGGLTPSLGLVIIASLLFYGMGLITNDLADRAQDLRERPDRPLVRGDISPAVAWVVAVAMTLIALGLCMATGRDAFRTGLLLTGAILAYNFLFKPVLVFGPTTMGLCRGLNFVLGATALNSGKVFTRELIMIGTLIMIYIGLVTQIARSEARQKPVGLERWLPTLVLVGGFMVLVNRIETPSILYWLRFTVPYFLACATTMIAAIRISQVSRAIAAGHEEELTGHEIAASIGLMISAMLFLQGAFAMSQGHSTSILFGMILLLCWPVSRIVSKTFYAS